MTDETIRRILGGEDILNRQLEPQQRLMDIVLGRGATAQALADIERIHGIGRGALGPLDDLRAAGVFGVEFQLAHELEEHCRVIEAFESNFRLPEFGEIGRLICDIKDVASPFREQEADLRRAIEGMQAPWLDIHDTLRSMIGFAELQGIGRALRTMPPFSSDLTEALRVDLGDWTEPIRWPDDIFTDPFARTRFYAERGFDQALSAFPAEAFEQSVTIAGLKGKAPPLDGAYSAKSESENDDEERAFRRTNEAHDRLQRFETQIRRFIDQRMTDVFGADWILKRLQGDIRKSWTEKRAKAVKAGESNRPLIAYSDFTDYVRIIVDKRNWNDVFGSIFERKTSVEESFQRLYPIRICAMHARMITQDDEIYLYAETTRLLAAIKIAT